MPWTDPEEVIDYWIGPDDISPEGWTEKQKLWYASDASVDDDIRARFGDTLKAAESGELAEWRKSLKGQLALIILFDQFSRNLYRGSADVYKNDAEAQRIADDIIASGKIDDLNVPASILVFHAWHHAEDKERQQQVVAQGERLLNRVEGSWLELVNGNFTYMKNHSGIIQRFGRFPHRNEILGRKSTPEETAFLEEDNRTYGQ